MAGIILTKTAPILPAVGGGGSSGEGKRGPFEWPELTE